MARSLTPEGKRITISVKVSEPEAAAIDAARGDLTRSAWLHQAIARGLNPGPRPTAKTVLPQAWPGLPDIQSMAKATCSHPAIRVHKGMCGACGTGGLR